MWFSDGLGRGCRQPWCAGAVFVAEFVLRAVSAPLQPYAVQQLGAVAGVMITASHNRKEDNGYKVRPVSPCPARDSFP